jgi:hypothetical protein
MAVTVSHSAACTPSTQCHRPFFGDGVGPVTMEYTEVKVLSCRERYLDNI